MNKLQQLIQQFCPDGVEWKTLGEVFEIRNGYTPSKAIKDFWEGGTIPWLRMEDIRTNGRILDDSIQHITPKAIKGKGLFKAYSIIMATTATIGEHALIIADSLANQQFTNFSIRKSLIDKLNHKFVYYYFFVIDEWCKQNVNVSSFPSVEIEKLKKQLFPIPPLAVQTEIVRILDKFSALTAELQAELQARKSQYEYYRNQLLDFSKGKVEWKTLGEVAERVSSGKNKEKLLKGKYPVFGSTCIIAYTDKYMYNIEQILVARVGANAGYVHKANGYYDVSDNTIIIKVKPDIVLQYLFYFLQKININTLAKGGGQPLITASDLKKISIPIPPLAEQERIVAILDKFDTLTNSISEGLPKEIELRQKQYEYYRNLLLTFPQKNG